MFTLLMLRLEQTLCRKELPNIRWVNKCRKKVGKYIWVCTIAMHSTTSTGLQFHKVAIVLFLYVCKLRQEEIRAGASSGHDQGGAHCILAAARIRFLPAAPVFTDLHTPFLLH